MVDAAHEKETRARETIQSLKLEIANLSKLVEQGAGLTMGQEHRWLFIFYVKIDLFLILYLCFQTVVELLLDNFMHKGRHQQNERTTVVIKAYKMSDQEMVMEIYFLFCLSQCKRTVENQRRPD